MLIGHGTFDGTDYKFNLPGPDITGAELAALLDRIPATRQLVVNMTSCQRRLHRVPPQAQPHRDHRHQERHRKERHRLRALLGRSACAILPPTPTRTKPSPRSKPSTTPSARPPNSSTPRSAWPPSTPSRRHRQGRRRAQSLGRKRRRHAGRHVPRGPPGRQAAAARDPEKRPLLERKEQSSRPSIRLKYREGRDAGRGSTRNS